MRTATSDLLKCPLSFRVRAGDGRAVENLYSFDFPHRTQRYAQRTANFEVGVSDEIP
jgi:hypothetical protein